MAALLTSYGVHFYSIPYLGAQPTLISVTGLSYSCQSLGRRFLRYRESLRSGNKPTGWKNNVHPAQVTMRLKLVENFDGSFQLDPKIAQNSGIDGAPAFEFTGEIFQPVPWSTNTKHGMPQVVWPVN